MSERKLKVFLCHASEDKPTVRELYRRLNAEGWIDAWLDKEKLLPGQDWNLEIEKAVETADVVVACLSSRSVGKEGYVQKELRFILDEALEKPEGTIFVIPLKLNDCEIPRSLQSWQWVDYFPVPQRVRIQAYQRILISLRQRAETLGIPFQNVKNAPTIAPVLLPQVIPSPESEMRSNSLRPEVRPHAFVLMPFGKKELIDGTLYDFNAIYSQLIKPALEAAGFESFRADEEITAGDILTDMLQELLLADICLVDMSLDNANVFYQLGIRHSLRKRGIVHIQAGQISMPFDVFNVPTFAYHITLEGTPDPRFTEKDRAGIARMVRDTWVSDKDSVHSPIFNLLEGLAEPDRRMLRIPMATGFWREYNEWKERMIVAQRQKQIGDILLLTEEIQNPLIKEEAIREGGQFLRNLGRSDLALTLYRKGLEINRSNLFFLREEARNLNRLGRVSEAIFKIKSILADHPYDTETIAYLGRLYKERWLNSWRNLEDPEKRQRAAFSACHWLIESFETFLKGFLIDLREYYPGVNAVTLGSILIELADRYDNAADPDPEIQKVRAKLPSLRGTLELLLEEKSADENADYWTLISLAELRVIFSKSITQVARTYRKAVSAAHENAFFLQASFGQLELLQSLQIRDEFVHAGMEILSEELRRLGGSVEKAGEHGVNRNESAVEQQGRIFLFAGYMIAYPNKKECQFPPEKEEMVRGAIDLMLEKHDAGPDDLAIVTGLDAGSEILFGEACMERGIPIQVYFPLPEAAYIRDFVSPGGEKWIERFYRLRNHPLIDEFYQPDCVGLPRAGDNIHERNNRWALYSALARGIDSVRLIAVWDGKNGLSVDLDAHLVKHMVDLMREMGGLIEQINPGRLSAATKTRKQRKP